MVLAAGPLLALAGCAADCGPSDYRAADVIGAAVPTPGADGAPRVE